MMNKRRLPAEWEKHDSTLLCWPHQKEDWPGRFMPIPWVYTEIIRHIIPAEKVRLIVQSAKHEVKVRRILLKSGIDLENIQFIVLTTDRGWLRDSSPAFVWQQNTVQAVNFWFNGWAKYATWHQDVHIPKKINDVLAIDYEIAKFKDRPVVLEGGAIDSNGRGTLLATEECLLDPKVQVRNPGFNKKDYEQVFKDYLGISNTIWLGQGIAGDDTHGHVDDLCRFVNHDTVVLCREENPEDENYKPLRENRERLQDARLEDGRKLNIIDLPMPAPVVFEGLRLPASYVNFYIANNAVLVPTFNDPNDRLALNIMSELFPDRKVTGIHAVDLVWGLGTIHCLTHEVPALNNEQ